LVDLLVILKSIVRFSLIYTSDPDSQEDKILFKHNDSNQEHQGSEFGGYAHNGLNLTGLRDLSGLSPRLLPVVPLPKFGSEAIWVRRNIRT